VVVIWIPTGAPGWTLEGAVPYDAQSIGGGIRTMYEIAAAIACAGRDVELRGAVSLPDLEGVCDAAGARPDLPGDARPLTAEDVVIVPEGIDDPALHARLALSPARTILMLLAPPGLVGWPFTGDWSPPDPLTVPLDAVGRPEHFRAAAALGYELWTHTPGLQAAVEAAGVPCKFVGNGVPGSYPAPPDQKDVDVAWLSRNRWAPLARPVVDELSGRGIECVTPGEVAHGELLALLGRARAFLHPLRVEGHSRLGCEARAMGAVPVVLGSNPFGVGLDAAGGAVAVDDTSEMAGAVLALLADGERLARMSATAQATARAQVEWEPFVARVVRALDEPEPQAAVARGARAAIGAAVAERDGVVAAEPPGLPTAAGRPARLLRRAIGSARARTDARARAQPRAFFHEPRGYLDWPEPGTALERAPVNLLGWALFPGTSVARVEVSIGGAPPELARLGCERADVAEQSDHRDAPVCGWEHKPDLSELPGDARSVSIEVVAHALDGRRLALPRAEFALVEPAPAAGTDDRRAELLRQRSARPITGVEPVPGSIRLLAFTHALGYGGAPLYLYELLLRLARDSGFECRVVALQDGPLRERFEEAGIPVHVTDAFPTASVESYEGRMAELTAWAVPQGFDAALVNTIGGFPGVDLAGRLGIPAVWAIHESFPLKAYWFAAYPRGSLHPYARARAERAFRHAQAVVFMADATRELFLSDIEPERGVTLPYGIEQPAIDSALRDRNRDAVRRRLGIAQGARVVLCLGSVEPRKAQALLAQAFARVADRHPDAVLALVGATGDEYSAGYRAGLREYVERAGLTDRVRIEPVTGDPLAWHLAADLLVCASDIESLPRSIAEAMAFGTPVLSTRVFGVPELIEDGRSGWLCEPRDLADLVRGLDRALDASDDERGELVRAARERVRARHDARRQTDRMLTLLRGSVADPGALPSEVLSDERADAVT
jgi:D-inositol-3-phosphate glycosyltransferase